MATESENNPREDSAADEPLARLSVAEYRNFKESGALNPKRKVELVEGLIVTVMRRSLRHDGGVEKVGAVLAPLVPNDWQLLTLPTLTTSDSEVEPDVVIAKKRLEEETNRPLLTSEVGMIVEVADASLLFDRRNKQRVYARANIPAYWILNLPDAQLEVFTKPSGPKPIPAYQDQRVYRIDDKLPVIVEEDLGMIRVGDMIP